MKELTTKEETLVKMAVVASSLAFGVEDYEILSSSNKRGNEKVSTARMCTYWLLKKTGELTYQQIGMAMGRDHAAILKGFRRIRNILDVNLEWGHSESIARSFQYFKEFYQKHRENEKKRKIEELENAL